MENGNISIQTENIFPIIKKWLYSEKDIYIRELVSNANDAISKLKKVIEVGDADKLKETKFKIEVVLNKPNKTIKIIDNGIGMTEDEVKRYINQIALSGAKDFLEKYKDKAEDAQIIGHFGLGFYSAFMVSEKVQIDTLSYKKDSIAVRWTSEGGVEYRMEPSDRENIGTTITLYLADDSKEFLDAQKMKDVLQKYFSFLPFEIYLSDESKKAKDAAKDVDAGKAVLPINDTKPLWNNAPKDCSAEEYKEFYKKVFNDYNEPLFWIHLNVDYPFKLKGILYFPQLKHEFETAEGQIKLYYNQVFVADNIKEVIPEFLMLLKGVLDCPDLPLNVSRSFLQNDGYVSKISSHITKKVADKLISIFEKDRESYNKYWDDINPFVKYGCLRDEKFYNKIKKVIIYKTTDGEYLTLEDYISKNKDKQENKVFYVSNEKSQAQYINMFKEQKMEAIILSSMIDSHFLQFIEMKENEIKFFRIDSEISDTLKTSVNPKKTDEIERIQEIFENIYKEIINDEKITVKVEDLKSETVPSIILVSEKSRRMQDMGKLYGGRDMSNLFPKEETLILNINNNLIKSMIKISGIEEKKDDLKMMSEHVFDLATLSNNQLEPEKMKKFIERSSILLSKLAE
ncbi:MAG: molecular chaperone HtpG [Clostridia bacterium]|jgi:molecular chaperone HtpG